MMDESPPAAMVKMPTMLDLSKVRAFTDGEKQSAAQQNEASPGPSNGAVVTGELMPFRRRYSDLEAMARAKKAATAAVAWMADAQHRVHRSRKSFEGVASSGGVRFVGSQDDGVVLHQPQPRVVYKSAAVQQEIETKKYSEMVERFQIRRMPHPSSYQTTNSITTSRSMSTARSVKVHPGMASETGKSDHHQHTHTRQSARSVSSVGRGPVLIPEDSSWRDLKDAVLHEAPAISWRGWFQQLKDDLRGPLSPVSKTSQVRSVVLIAGFVFHMIFFPLETAYFDKISHSEVAEGLEQGFGLLLVVDCFVTLNTSYYSKRGELVTSRKAIARRYARGWLLLDLVSSIPVDWMFSDPVTVTAGMKWSYAVLDGIFRLPRLIHVTQIARQAWQPRLHESDRSIFTMIFYSRYSHLFSIAKMIVSIIIGAHYMACILKLLSANDTVTAATPLADYVSNFYDALQLLQGQGVTTTSVAESAFAAITLLIGSVVLAIVFGHVAILVSNFNANSTNYQRKMESVFAIMSKLQLPAPLRERIHQYYEHLWREYESLDGEIVSFSKGLSHTLELEVVLFKYMDLIMHVPFWCDGSPDFQKQLMLHLSVQHGQVDRLMYTRHRMLWAPQ